MPHVERQASLLAEERIDLGQLPPGERRIEHASGMPGCGAEVDVVRGPRVELERQVGFGPLAFFMRSELEALVLGGRDAALDFEIVALARPRQIVHPVLATDSAAEVEELSTLHLV